MTQPERDLLTSLLSAPLQQESEVLRFLIEVRKCIEQMEARYPVLTFFCDWLVHPTLDRKPAREILKELDTFVAEHISSGLFTKGSMDKIAPLIGFLTFRRDLLLFLGEHGLDTELIGNLNRWKLFFSA
jgi:hypothetical protein